MEYCSRCKYRDKREHEEPCAGCIHNAVENFKPMTNADRIRAMTDEELADFMYDTATGNECCICGYKEGWHCKKESDKPCSDGVLTWLKAEVGCE